jgi:hypothetical protein
MYVLMGIVLSFSLTVMTGISISDTEPIKFMDTIVSPFGQLNCRVNFVSFPTSVVHLLNCSHGSFPETRNSRQSIGAFFRSGSPHLHLASRRYEGVGSYQVRLIKEPQANRDTSLEQGRILDVSC